MLSFFVGGEDYVPLDYYREFNDNETTKTLPLIPIDDNIVEIDETYKLSITFLKPHDRIKIGQNPTTTIIIYDDDSKW